MTASDNNINKERSVQEIRRLLERSRKVILANTKNIQLVADRSKDAGILIPAFEMHINELLDLYHEITKIINSIFKHPPDTQSLLEKWDHLVSKSKQKHELVMEIHKVLIEYTLHIGALLETKA